MVYLLFKDRLINTLKIIVFSNKDLRRLHLLRVDIEKKTPMDLSLRACCSGLLFHITSSFIKRKEFL